MHIEENITKRSRSSGIKFHSPNKYYFNSSKKAVRNGTYYVTKHNDLLPEGDYVFDADGKMVNPPTATAQTGTAYVMTMSATSSYQVWAPSTTTTYNYVYNGDKLSQMTVGTETLNFTYDASGTPMSVIYDDSTDTAPVRTFYYVTNIQGDVIAILDDAGTAVVEYTYDAWGNPISSTDTSPTSPHALATLNPLRYRSYLYDSEYEFYYLQSRYYNPKVGRFLNTDEATNLGAEDNLVGFNLFAYCTNNPVNRTDENGNASLPNWAKIAIGVGIIAGAALLTVATGGAAAGTVVAAVHCMAQGAMVGAITQGAIGAVSGAASGAITHRMTTGSWSGAANAAADGAASGFLSGTITGAVTGALSSPYCFVAGTTVLVAAGVAAIETIQEGDYVWAWDEETGTVGLKKVVETYINETDELVHVHVNGEEIVTTPSHPFYSPVRGWTEAARLRAGDILVLVNGEYVVVEKVQHEILEAPIEVYNFQVEDYHTYYVTNLGILVHNSCGMTNKEAAVAAKKLGYTKVKGASSHGNAVFTNPKAAKALRYITADADSHVGGVWKAADTVANLGSKATRSGTYNALLEWIAP